MSFVYKFDDDVINMIEKLCWLALSSKTEHIKTENGTYLKLTQVDCSTANKCMEAFNKSMFTGKETLTEDGLIAEPRKDGNLLMIKWLRENCRHPQKQTIIKHVASIRPLGVLIPTPLLKKIEELLEESR